MLILPNSFRRPDDSVGMAFVLPALTDPVVRIPAGPLRSLKCDPPKGTGADHKKSSSLILLCIVLCSVFRSVPLGRVSLACLGCPCSGWPLPVRFSCGFLPCGLARSLLASPPLPSPPGCFLVLSGPVSPAGPSVQISGCVCNGPVVIPLAWRVVTDWLVSSLRFMATKASALGLCPLHHVVGVIHVPLAAALRYSPSGDPEFP